ncbi:MAG: hypothetical protein PHU27_07275 [Salinivirgaceae bacterium]|nr:hypothetical protein [Salinivirgaceae bacterium]MDD4746495.1 hypothetical protein [Salinivirgaceae bacterium]MDY0280135.1 hypothetical protein [Salinivirgaceae bacterium]
MPKILIIVLCFIILWGCDQTNQQGTTGSKSRNNELVDTINSTQILNINDNLFSIPSPHQVSKILIDLKIEYNPEILNPTQNTRKYSNSYKKALNLGVYGADLGYVNLYEKTQEAITYFSVIKILAEELDISNAFNKETIKSIEKNLTNQDSLLHLLSNSYQDIDLFLKTNDQEHTGVLILAGGWIESMFMLTQFAINTNNQQLCTRIGENKHPLSNLIKILSKYTEKNKIYQTLVDKLITLQELYDNIEVNYTYEYSETHPEQKITKIYSKTEITISKEDLKKITTEISNIRNFVIL